MKSGESGNCAVGAILRLKGEHQGAQSFRQTVQTEFLAHGLDLLPVHYPETAGFPVDFQWHVVD